MSIEEHQKPVTDKYRDHYDNVFKERKKESFSCKTCNSIDCLYCKNYMSSINK